MLGGREGRSMEFADSEGGAAGGNRRPARSVDHYCVMRLRYRRLLAFLIKNDYTGGLQCVRKTSISSLPPLPSPPLPWPKKEW
uniref:Uncharacterized protein n=1 Tax=Oryza brachyantha TaxID=4533 RepID=J3M1D5_ORYBR